MSHVLTTPIADSFGNAESLDRLADELRSLLQTIEELRLERTPVAPRTSGGELVDSLQSYLAGRRARHEILGPGWFSDPVWDLLLDLWICEREGRPVPISNACIAAGVPWTTGLRWIDKLVHAGFVRRWADPDDRRRSLLSLDPGLANRLESWVTRHLACPTDSSPALLAVLAGLEAGRLQ